MKRLMSLWSQVAEESATYCCTSASHDINTVMARVEHEGLSFLTITLPDLGKAIQKWLDQGEVGIHSSFLVERGGRLPRFLGGFFSRVFDRSSGLLLEDPCIASIRALRQLTLMFGKMELPCSPARQRKAVMNYLKCEQEVRELDRGLCDSDIAEFTAVSSMLFGRVFDHVDRDVYYDRLIPRHGPGSTADGITGNRKFDRSVWTSRLEAVFAAGEHLLPNWRYNLQLEEVDFLEPGQETPVKVTLVPKTLKTPRVIAMEPVCMQYMQQAILRSFLESFYEDDFLPKVIGFDDQVPNQELARQGSLDQRTATLDLSDASDRVSNQLVRAMLSRHPHLLAGVDATRSRRATLPDGRKVRLAKFASMGSALCFPFEAMVFTTAIFLGLEAQLGHRLDRKDVLSFRGKVRVFGDDIIIPEDSVPYVTEILTRLGFKINISKSFWRGKFRESCGGDYYDGVDVTPIRVRRVFPSSRSDVPEVQSLVALRNLLYERGLWKTTRWLDENIVGKFLPHFPIVEPTAPCLGRRSFLPYQAERLDEALQAPRVRAYRVKPRIPASQASGIGSLLKCLLPSRGPEMDPFEDERHLERAGRPSVVDIKLKWCSPF
jgi:hypothetical protein